MTNLAVGTPKLCKALPKATPCANCKWGWVTTYVNKNGVLRKTYVYICEAADEVRPALKEMDVAICVEIKFRSAPTPSSRHSYNVAPMGRSYSAASMAWRSRRWRGTELNLG